LGEEHEVYNGDSWLSKRVEYVKGDEIPTLLEPHYSIVGRRTSEVMQSLAARTGFDGVDFSDTYAPFLTIASIVKHSNYRIETEARVVVHRWLTEIENQRSHKIYHRSGARPLSYIKLVEGELLGPRSPVEKIVVGPHHDRERRVDAVRRLLNGMGLDVPVSVSSLPRLDECK
jgi:hypothetical protein